MFDRQIVVNAIEKITVQVIQRPGGGIVRGVIASPPGETPRGATVLNSLRYAEVPLNRNTFSRAVKLSRVRVHANSTSRCWRQVSR